VRFYSPLKRILHCAPNIILTLYASENTRPHTHTVPSPSKGRRYFYLVFGFAIVTPQTINLLSGSSNEETKGEIFDKEQYMPSSILGQSSESTCQYRLLLDPVLWCRNGIDLRSFRVACFFFGVMIFFVEIPCWNAIFAPVIRAVQCQLDSLRGLCPWPNILDVVVLHGFSWDNTLANKDLYQSLQRLHILSAEQIIVHGDGGKMHETAIQLQMAIDMPKRTFPMTVVKMGIAAEHLLDDTSNVRVKVRGEARGFADPVIVLTGEL
jgi:hypothetical protein